MLVERPERGTIRHTGLIFGRSHDGLPLTVWLPDGESPEILLLAAVHGDEAETTVILSETLRSVHCSALRNAVVLCGNPDGLVRGTRGNANGVDLNRNFPAANWSPEPVFYKSRRDDAQDIRLSPGTEPASEPETRALLALLDRLQPRAVVSLHAALACIDDAEGSALAIRISELTGLPLQPDIGYPTPGSFGSWAQEQRLTLVTYELEAASPYDLKERHVPVLRELMTGALDLEE